MNAAVEDITIPETTLSPAQEQTIDGAAKLLEAGVDTKLVLRTLYTLARMDGICA